MDLTDKQRAFLDQHHRAAMVTLRRDGAPHAVRVAVALVDGKLWSSGVPGRVRTRHLRRDPRCTFFVFGPSWEYLTLEGRGAILEGPEAPDQSVRLFQAIQAGMQPGPPPGHLMWEGKTLSLEVFRRTMAEERRLIYELEIERADGLQ